MKKGKLLILCLVMLLVMGGIVSAQKGDKAQKTKEKIEKKMAKVRIKGLDKLRNLEVHLDGLAERLACLKDFEIDIDMSGLHESLKCLESLKDIKVHLHGLEALEALENMDIDIEIPEFDFDFDFNFDFDFDGFFECAKKSKSAKKKRLEKSSKKIKKTK